MQATVLLSTRPLTELLLQARAVPPNTDVAFLHPFIWLPSSRFHHPHQFSHFATLPYPWSLS